ncbi:hypothetical protein [Capybara microvirus Cap3_SP_330]|nr:hypothetical protein [Capybara microvirus Cap3_SP_330]
MIYNNPSRLAHPVYLDENNTATAQGASLTPHQIRTLTAEGIPIAPQSIGALDYHEGCTGEDMSILPCYQRGVDLNDVWNYLQNGNKQNRNLSINDPKS